MNMKTATQLMIGLVGALSLTTAVALDGAGGKDKLTEEHKNLMSQLDINQDGVISESEAQQNPELAQRFRELDENGDQVLERAEFAQFEVTDEDPEE